MKRLPLFIIIFVLALWLARIITNNFIAMALVTYRQDGESRELALFYAPNNPLVAAAHGKFFLYRAAEPQFARGLASLQRAAALTPNDYRYQLELGRALATNKQNAEAEQALQRAIQLAPRHFETHWTYANFAIRTGKRDEALNALRQALSLSGQDRAYRGDIEKASAHGAYSALVGAYGFDLSALERATPATPIAQTHLVSFLAQPPSLDLALSKWRTLPVADAALYRSLLFQLLDVTQQAGRWPEARAVWQRLLQHEGDAQAEDSKNLLTNGGFERVPLPERFPLLTQGFDWQIEGHAEIAADRTDTQAHSGKQALRLRMVARPGTPFQHVTQRVIVTPGKAYRLSFWVKAQELPDGLPYLEISDSIKPELFRLRTMFPRDTTDWQEQSLRFTAPANTNVLTLRLCVPVIPSLNQSRRNSAWLDDVTLREER